MEVKEGREGGRKHGGRGGGKGIAKRARRSKREEGGYERHARPSQRMEIFLR